jgi:hypothetical protein
MHTCPTRVVAPAGCPDCNVAKPRIDAALDTIAEGGQDVVLVEAMVARAEYKGHPEVSATLPHATTPGTPCPQ